MVAIHSQKRGGHGPDITTVEQLRAIVPEPMVPVAAKIRDHLDAQALWFVEAALFLLLPTISADEQVEVSPKGDAPGFVVAEDDETLLIPNRDGNKLAPGHLNVLTNP